MKQQTSTVRQLCYLGRQRPSAVPVWIMLIQSSISASSANQSLSGSRRRSRSAVSTESTDWRRDSEMFNTADTSDRQTDACRQNNRYYSTADTSDRQTDAWRQNNRHTDRGQNGKHRPLHPFHPAIPTCLPLSRLRPSSQL